MTSASDSSDDDLGLFSFANKKAIVGTPPPSPNGRGPLPLETQPVEQQDWSLFQPGKRRRLLAPHIIEEDTAPDALNSDLNISLEEYDNEKALAEKIKQYDSIVDNICNIDAENSEVQGKVRTTKKFKQTTEKRNQLISNLDGVLNKYKRTIDCPAPAPSSSEVHDTSVTEDDVRPYVLKFKKAGSLHRFKVTWDTALIVALEHMAPKYEVSALQFILQLNDKAIDPNKTPRELGLTVVDIIEVLTSTSVPTSDLADIESEEEDDPNVITIKVQSTGHRNNAREYKVFKDKPLTEYLYKACQDFGFGAAKYFFDGAPIDPRKTPNALDMEDLDCLDVVEQS